MTTLHQRIPCAYLLLFAVVLALASTPSSTSMFASALSPSMTSSFTSRGRIVIKNGKTVLRMAEEEQPNGSATPAPPSAATGETPFIPQQKDFGQTLELPNTYASCGQCGASFALTLESMGPGKGGRRMECGVCNHTWFQSRDRLATLGDGFEMIPLPERDMTRIKTNIDEGRHPKYFGEFKMYVGNISFQCSEDDLTEFFETIGPVGDVSLVRDKETGRARGFGFITMMKKEDGEKALATLDGAELKGRNLNVRPSTN